MNIPEFSMWIFISGCIGALAPEIIRLYKARSNPKLKFSLNYLVISLLFLLLGGFVAWILPTSTLWGAFYAGVSLPIIISSIGKSKKSLESEELSQLQRQLEIIKRSSPFEVKKALEDERGHGADERQFFAPEEKSVNKLRDYLGVLFQ